MSNNNCTTNHAIMFFFLLSFLLVYNHAFFSSSPSKPTKSKPRNPPCSCNCPAAVASAADPTITLFIAFLSGALFTLLCILTITFPALFTVPIRSAVDFSSSCVRHIKSIRASSPPPRQPIVHSYSSAATSNGISTSLLNSLPTFVYSSEKRHNFGKGVGVCAICLSKFLNDQTLRWLPDCDHLFHQECIDTWFQSNKTCPCCRANVDRAGGETLLLENSDSLRSSSFRRMEREDGGSDLNNRRRIGCERSAVGGLIRVLLGRRRSQSNRQR